MNRIAIFSIALLVSTAAPFRPKAGAPVRRDDRPNILFCIADDWSWPHAGIYGDRVIKTPTFDRIAKEGLLFKQAYAAAPSCTPSRAAILTGQYPWRLREGANLWSTLHEDYPVFPNLLEKAGYHVGFTRKGWGPGRLKPGGRVRNPAGPKYKDFAEFLRKRPKGEPFCFWFGSSDPHRGYKKGSGAASGMDLSKIELPGCLPDSPEVRSDVADYFWEVQRFDQEVGELMKQVEALGELDNTIVVMTSDHGMPFPRCKANLYDTGTRVPLAVRWPEKIKEYSSIDYFISLIDMGPTILELIGIDPPREMTGRSLVAMKDRRVPPRKYILYGKERHTLAQEAPDTGGTPMRAIRTKDYLYIRNFTPDRWPAGTPDHLKATKKGAWFSDCDNGPTKFYMADQRDKNAQHRRLFDLAFARRPAEELYELQFDPHQLRNRAGDSGYASILKNLSDTLMDELRKSGDPRVVGGAEIFETAPYYGGVGGQKRGYTPEKK